MLTLMDRLVDCKLQSPQDALIKRLEKLLNTREGDCLCKNDYGLFDLGDIENSSAALTQLANQIEQTIKQNEPALSNVNVRPSLDQPQQHYPHFVIQASLSEQPIYLFTQLEHNNLSVRY